MKKEIIIAGGIGLVAGLVIMHFAMKKKETKSGADGDFVTDRSKKAWDNMLDVTGTPIDPKGGMVTGRVSNMLDANADEVSNMLDVQGTRKPMHDYADGSDDEDESNMLDATGNAKGRYFPQRARRQQAVQNAIQNRMNSARGGWPNPKTGSGWS
jgi:hypothetical protein